MGTTWKGWDALKLTKIKMKVNGKEYFGPNCGAVLHIVQTFPVFSGCVLIKKKQEIDNFETNRDSNRVIPSKLVMAWSCIHRWMTLLVGFRLKVSCIYNKNPLNPRSDFGHIISICPMGPPWERERENNKVLTQQSIKRLSTGWRAHCRWGLCFGRCSVKKSEQVTVYLTTIEGPQKATFSVQI